MSTSAPEAKARSGPVTAADADGRWRALGVAVVFLAFFWRLGAFPLVDLDEGAFSEATREMLESGVFSATYLDGEPRYDKPILIYWLQAASVSVFGPSEWAFRLPSALAAAFWMLVVWRFTRQFGDARAAALATVFASTTLGVSMIGRAAIADAVLNLWLALAFVDLVRWFRTPGPGLLLRIYAWLALGFLTKGPVAIALPLLASTAYAASTGQWERWRRAVFHPAGWAVFLLVVLPWHVLVYLEQGWGFFAGFYLEHNIGRFTDTMQGHGGSPFYYLGAGPLMLVPVAGAVVLLLLRPKDQWRDPLYRFGWLWFAVTFAVFSASSTQLPHYLLYGCTPLFSILALQRDRLEQRWLLFLPPFLFMALLALLPWLLEAAADRMSRAYEAELLAGADRYFRGAYHLVTGAGLVAMASLFALRPPRWRGLVIAGFVQVVVLWGMVAPRILHLKQDPIRVAAALAVTLDAPVVAYGIRAPSFSVYRDAVTPRRVPEPGEVAFTRVDRLDALRAQYPERELQTVYRAGGVALVRVPEG